MRRRTALALFTVAPLFAGRSAFAAGWYVPDTGTVARARGGAVVVRADDPLAIVYNPAGLADQRRIQILADVSTLRLNMTFERDGVPSDAEGGTVAKSEAPLQYAPALVYTHPMGNRFVFAAGAVAPARPRWKFQAKGPQRFTNSERVFEEATYGFALAVRPHPMMSVGLYGGALYTSVTQDFHFTRSSPANTPPQPPPSEAPGLDLPARLEVKDPFTLTAGAGMKVYLSPQWELGFSYRPEAAIDAGGTLVTRDPEASEEDVHLAFILPAIWRGGARYVGARWDLELDVVWEGWGPHDEEALSADDGNFAGAREAIVERQFRDAWCVRVGGSVRATPSLELHAGSYFETGAVPTRTLDVATYDPNKVGIGIGASVDVAKHVVLSLNVTHTFLETVDVEDSRQRQQSRWSEDVVPASSRSIVGNGTYSGSYDMAGFSVLARF